MFVETGDYALSVSAGV